MKINDISAEVVDAALKVHRALGPGLLEQVYKIVLKLELEKRGLDVQAEVGIPISYEQQIIDNGVYA